VSNWGFFWDPLRGKTSLSRVIVVYGIVGSLAYGALALLFDVTDERSMWVYNIGGLILTIYVTIATYQCARNCHSVWMRNLVRVSAVLSLLLLPLLTYVVLSGAIDLTSLRGEQ
jgi:hypothetical protein